MLEGEELPELPSGENPIDLLEMVLEALKLAIDEFPLDEYKPLEEYIGYGDDVPYYRIDPQLLEQLNIPRVMIAYDSVGVPLLVVRTITKEGRWVGESKFDLSGVGGHFTGKALELANVLRDNGLNMTDEDRRTFIVRRTVNMLKDAFSKANERMETTVNSFIEEVYWDWAELWYEHHAEYNSLLGYRMKPLPLKKQLEKVLKAHQSSF